MFSRDNPGLYRIRVQLRQLFQNVPIPLRGKVSVLPLGITEEQTSNSFKIRAQIHSPTFNISSMAGAPKQIPPSRGLKGITPVLGRLTGATKLPLQNESMWGSMEKFSIKSDSSLKKSLSSGGMR